ncbi:unnamed protein product [Lathyrus sativus]|nr:unnamed protein product [Lathyrus sativus]
MSNTVLERISWYSDLVATYLRIALNPSSALNSFLFQLSMPVYIWRSLIVAVCEDCVACFKLHGSGEKFPFWIRTLLEPVLDDNTTIVWPWHEERKGQCRILGLQVFLQHNFMKLGTS